MRMKNLLLICVCCALAAPAGWGQTANSQAKGILGYLDPHTGAFRPVPPAATEDPDVVAAATTVGGTINVTLTITLKTTTITTVTCSENVSLADGTTSPRFFEETNTVAATGTGSTRTCKLSIPYSWSLTTQSTDNMNTGYSVFGSAGTNALPQRTSTLSPLDVRKVPANGTITALTAAVTL